MTVEADARAALTAWPGLQDAVLAPLGDGHINDTWLVSAAAERRVLQRINPAVFPDPAGVAAKVARVVSHLQGSRIVTVPALIETRQGAAWHEDAAGVWRVWTFIEQAGTVPALTSDAQAHAAGLAFGSFQRALASLEVDVDDPIPGYMQLRGYLPELDRRVRECMASSGGAAPDRERVERLLDIVERRRLLADTFIERDRLVHGDCKVDNLLFRRDSVEVAAIIDLDTVMLGHWAWDFGDLVRSVASGPGGFGVDRFAAVAGGFLAGAHMAPLPDLLVQAPRYVALTLGVRFLTDHLRGDRYFKVSVRGENLRRAEAQFDLLLAMEAAEAEVRQRISRLP